VRIFFLADGNLPTIPTCALVGYICVAALFYPNLAMRHFVNPFFPYPYCKPYILGQGSAFRLIPPEGHVAFNYAHRLQHRRRVGWRGWRWSTDTDRNVERLTDGVIRTILNLPLAFIVALGRGRDKGKADRDCPTGIRDLNPYLVGVALQITRYRDQPEILRPQALIDAPELPGLDKACTRR
jgi:hypothetical protein